VSATELPEMRRADYSLSDVQAELRRHVAQFFARECPTEVVRAADPVAFDASLWAKLQQLGVLSMAVPADAGGDGAGLVEAALVAEECGRRVAPVPFVEHVVATRAIAALTGSSGAAPWVDGERILTFAPLEQRTGGAALVPSAAIADGVVGLLEGSLVVVEPDSRPPVADTLGGAPVGRCDLRAGRATVLARGDEAWAAHARARREWQLLTAAALVGLADGALDLTVAYANERFAFGVPIGTFQALSHPLVDVRIAVEGARHLVWRAAWYLDHEPERAALHVATAYLHACETAQQAAATGIHTEGGFGFTLESDLHLYFRRAKTWPLVAGDPLRELAVIADLAFGLSA
jgi:alkylation response protein AidB-like acyl-CoA dehydrogenase